MTVLNIDKYCYNDPMFEGARIILSFLGETYSPEYIQGVSGAAFKIAGGCPSRPTCVCDMWTTDFVKYMGYEITDYPCFDKDNNDISDKMIDAVKRQIDSGKPALVWNAFTAEEWDVVCGYDEGQFIGRGTYKGNDDFAREAWDRAKASNVYAFGAVIIGNKVMEFNKREAEIASLKSAVKHARKETDKIQSYEYEGIQFYKKWVEIYSNEGADRGIADAYCFEVYSSVRKAGVLYLREISGNYGSHLKNASDCFEREAEFLDSARPYVSWGSPWGVDEERSKKLAPILKQAAEEYEKGIEFIEKALSELGIRN